MNDIKLGQLITDDMTRDAVHIAIAPVIAAELLKPGQHVGIHEGKRASTGFPLVGIIDPFLKHDVKPGDRCFLLMYPNTVQQLRHEWSHDAFSHDDARPTPQEAMDIIKLRAEIERLQNEKREIEDDRDYGCRGC